MKPARKIAAGTRAQLRLLATSDLHMHLKSYDYYADRADVSVGLARTAGLIRTARSEADKCGTLTLLFDNGDSLQGTPLGDHAAQFPGQIHPLMRAFDHLRYDAIGLGNHDFNFGLDSLLAFMSKAPCPVVCSNLLGADGQSLAGIVPFAVLDRTVQADGAQIPIRVGVLSFLPPQTVQWDVHLLQGRILVDDILRAAQQRISLLRQADCDLVVALAHSGLDDTPVQDGMENAVLPLAALPGIDAVIAGHTHLHLPGPAHGGLRHVNARTGEVHGKPVVMPGTAGSHLGVIDLRIETGPDGRWKPAGFDCALRPISVRDASGTLVPTTREDRALSNLLAPDHQATRALMHRPVGHTDHPLHSYFSFIAADRAMAVVAAAQAAALQPLLCDTPLAELPLLSAVSPCKFGARSGPLFYTDVPQGGISLRHVADLHVFPNQMRAIVVTGRQVLDWLEMSAILFHRIAPGSIDAPLVDLSIPGHDFDLLHGLSWQIDLTAPPRFLADGTLSQTVGDTSNRRICNLRYGNAPVAPDQQFVVALNSYRAGGGGGFAALKQARDVPIPPMAIRDIICDYVSGTLPPHPLADASPTWRFKPIPGTSVSLQTGPGATAYLGELADRNVKVSGPGADGFLRLTLPL